MAVCRVELVLMFRNTAYLWAALMLISLLQISTLTKALKVLVSSYFMLLISCTVINISYNVIGINYIFTAFSISDEYYSYFDFLKVLSLMLQVKLWNSKI